MLLDFLRMLTPAPVGMPGDTLDSSQLTSDSGLNDSAPTQHRTVVVVRARAIIRRQS